jgi:hypothetical protein
MNGTDFLLYLSQVCLKIYLKQIFAHMQRSSSQYHQFPELSVQPDDYRHLEIESNSVDNYVVCLSLTKDFASDCST